MPRSLTAFTTSAGHWRQRRCGRGRRMTMLQHGRGCTPLSADVGGGEFAAAMARMGAGDDCPPAPRRHDDPDPTDDKHAAMPTNKLRLPGYLRKRRGPVQTHRAPCRTHPASSGGRRRQAATTLSVRVSEPSARGSHPRDGSVPGSESLRHRACLHSRPVAPPHRDHQSPWPAARYRRCSTGSC